ncbi:MAG: PBP1A family penicillin-binding protein [Actinomycetota bacterium]
MASGVLVVLLCAAGLVVWSYVLFPSVSIPDQDADSLAQTTRIYAADGALLATLHGEINRDPVPLDQLPEHVAQAAVASEDARFYEHGGVDTKAVLRALVKDLVANDWVQGGSTITQQYVKKAYVGNKRTLGRKIQEARVARELERKLTKDQILELYLNTVYFGSGAYGIEAAARAFYDKPAAELTASEAAQLIGVIPAPVRYSPREHPQEAEQRRLWVVDRMATLGFLSPEDAAAVRADKPQLAAVEPALTSDEDATSAWFVDAVKRYLFARYGADRVLTGGLEVQTTLDPTLQVAAEKIVARTFPNPEDPYAALASVDPETGYVRALVGGRDYQKEKYNIAVQGRRQPGSAFKPFVLVAALEEGIKASDVFSGPGTICLQGWKPDCTVHNYGGSGFGRISLENATANSVNTVFAQLIMRIGSDKVVDVAGRMGIPAPDWMVPPQVGCRPLDSPACRTHLRPMPALALGAQEVTPLEMASAYATLAADGVYREPKVVSKVVDRSGAVLEDGPSEGRQVLDRRIAEEANRILAGVITRGTGRRADIGRPASGKTGTTQDNRNAWFVGYTEDMSTAVWMGYRDTNAPLVDIQGFKSVTGGTIPAVMWAQYMSDPDLKITQSPAAGPFLVGREIPLRFTVSNDGPWPAGGVTLTDPVPAGLAVVSYEVGQGTCTLKDGPLVCSLGDLEAGKSVTLSIVLRPDAAGSLVHTASVGSASTDPTPDNNVQQRQFNVLPAAELVVRTQTDQAPQLLGGTLTYTSTVTNEGPSPATGVAHSQSLPRRTELVSSTAVPAAGTATRGDGTTHSADPLAGFCRRDGQELLCSLGDIPVGGSATVSLVIRPETTGRYASTASAKAAEADGTRANNRAQATSTVIPSADLVLTGTSPSEAVPIGRRLTYTFAVRNTGPSEATEVVFTDVLPAGSSLESVKSTVGTCKDARASVVCELGTLGVSAEAKVTIEVVPSSTGPAVAEGRLTAEEADPVPADAIAAPTSIVVPSTDLSVEGTAADPIVLVGEDLSYELHVENHGLSPSTGVTLSTPLPEGVSLMSAPVLPSGSAPASCKLQERVVVCHLGSMGVRERARVTLVLRAEAPGPVEIRPWVRGADLDPEADNNEVGVVATVAGGSAGTPPRFS